jgi:hypothetical protein
LLDPLVLYSATTRLAYDIAQTYYRGVHYAWCAPAPSRDAFGVRNPRSSDPIALYWSYWDDCTGGDRHSDLLQRHRQGIARGAEAWANRGVISTDERKEIELMAFGVSNSEFSPLLLVTPYDKVGQLAKLVPVADRARPSSREYIIEELPRDLFDVLRLKD